MSKKVYISYCRKNPNVKNWILTTLIPQLEKRRIGIIWDQNYAELQEYNHDFDRFMEGIYKDELIDAILVVSDKYYLEKDKKNQGGVATELKYIRMLIKEDPFKKDVIPVIFESDENGEAYRPTCLRSIGYCNFSKDKEDSAEFSKIINRIFPVRKETQIGLRDIVERYNSGRVATRADVVILAFELSGITQGEDFLFQNSYFDDIDDTFECFQAAVTLLSYGIVQYSQDPFSNREKMFYPGNPVRRDEALGIVIETFGIPYTKTKNEHTFRDVDQSHESLPYVETAYAFSIIEKPQDGLFYPGKNITFNELANFALKAAEPTLRV